MTKRGFILIWVLSVSLLFAGWKENLEKAKDLLDNHWSREREALPLLQAAYQEKPDDKEVLFFLGRTLYQLREFDKAVPFFKKAFTLDDKHYEALAYYAYCIGRLADKEKNMAKQLSMQNEAKKYLEASLKVNPNYRDGWMAYAIGMHWFGKRGGGLKWAYEDAEKYFQKAFKIDPRHSYLNVEYAYFKLTLNQKEEADRYFKRAMAAAKSDIKDGRPNYNIPRSIAIYLEDHGYYQEALEYAKIALEWNPQDLHTFEFLSIKKIIARLEREIASGKRELKEVSDEMQ